MTPEEGERARFFEGVRLERERRTVAAMIEIYCRAQHDAHAAGGALCPECADLEAYTRLRLEKCPYGEAKPTCANCRIHCYQPHRREQVKGVMAFAGPRILWRHPVLAVRHMLDGRREAPPLVRGRAARGAK
ncbi:MAG TPA: nitrous oxide-stimulated promoter family protein [Thermoanaerobaculia bacterium]|nr:nitrous oxide-stimulated promoter family protein [Thermoanaerobaculia bacterium]